MRVIVRKLRDTELIALIGSERKNKFVHLLGARKMWLRLRGKGHDVARCTIERLMREMGITGVTRGKAPRTTIADEKAQRPKDLVDRQFVANRPNELWCADFTYVATWEGMVYVAFIFDVFSRMIIGWRAATSMTTPLVLDALEMALWTRRKAGITDLAGLVHHTDAGSQHTSIAFTERLLEAGVDGSVGTVRDGYDNALAESQIGLYKSELINNQPWKDCEHVEIGTLDWVHWFNNERPHESIDDLTPVQAEQFHYTHRTRLTETG